jgi:hypothetical protein
VQLARLRRAAGVNEFDDGVGDLGECVSVVECLEPFFFFALFGCRSFGCGTGRARELGVLSRRVLLQAAVLVLLPAATRAGSFRPVLLGMMGVVTVPRTENKHVQRFTVALLTCSVT